MSTKVAVRRWYDSLFEADPWTNVYAIGRSLIALSPLLTLVVNPTWLLFAPSAAGPGPRCDGLIGTIGFFCVIPATPVAHVLAIAVLAMVVAGWRPRWTALPHAWIAVSLHNSMTIVEGGDQIAGNLALLLLPVALLDPRPWHWCLSRGADRAAPGGDTTRMVANTMLLLIRLQVCVIYLHAAVGKLYVDEWLDGTSIYYWTNDPVFGADGPRGALAGVLTGTAAGVTALTWGSILLELALAFALIASAPVRRGLFWAGIAFHAGIALLLGLMTFGVSMAAALLLYLWPRDQAPDGPGRVAAWVRRRWAGRRTRPEPGPAAEPAGQHAEVAGQHPEPADHLTSSRRPVGVQSGR